MKISGFTFVRNAVKYDYPIVEAVKSILPVCDEIVVAVGKSEDGTLGLIESIGSPKIRIIKTIWDDSIRGGNVMAVETDKALDAVSPDCDWAFYIQADECFHEDDLPTIKSAMERWKDDQRVDGLLFNHIHFYGTYNHYADSRRWIKKEVRVIRNDRRIRSLGDAMTFCKNGKKLDVKAIDATIYHYGWVKPPAVQQQKRRAFDQLYLGDEQVEKSDLPTEFDYSRIESVAKFEGTHPKVMWERIRNQNWNVEFDKNKAMKLRPLLAILNYIYQQTGIIIGGYKNYRIIRGETRSDDAPYRKHD